MIIIIITIVVIIIIIITRREIKNGTVEIQDSFLEIVLRNILKKYKKYFEENNKTVKLFGMAFKKLYI